MEQISSDNTYETPADTPRGVMNYICLNTRLGFFLPFFRIILSYRSICLKKQHSPESWVDHSYRIFRTVERSGGRVHIEGLDNLRNVKEPLVVVSNHMGSMETMTLPALLYPFLPMTFVVKKSLQTGRLFGPIMMAQDTIGVGRVNPREDFQTVLTEGTKTIQNGLSVVIFPQSTRNTTFIPEQFNSLGVKLARRAKVKVLPVALKTDFWDNGKLIKDFGPIVPSRPIHFAFGEPMDITGNGSEQHQKCIDFISSHMEKWTK